MSGCPKCQGTTGYLRKVRMIGHVTHRGQWGGEEKPTEMSDMRDVPDKSVTCIDCGRRTYTKKLRMA